MTSRSMQSNAKALFEVGWYILDANRQQIGPYTILELREHFLNGYLPESTFVWSEGRSEWQTLSSVPELMAGVYVDRTQSSSLGQEESLNVYPRESVSTISESGTAPASNDDEFENCQNEVKEAKLLKNGAGSAELDECEKGGSSTPPEGEEFADDGTLYKGDRSLRSWVPQELQGSVEEGYALDDMVFIVEEEVFPTPKVDYAFAKEDNRTVGAVEEVEAKKGAKRKKPEKKKEVDEMKHNIYVTGLPDDATFEEAVELFSKCGVIKENPRTKKPRVKFFVDKATNTKKGGALVTYLKKPSVALARQFLHGTSFRPGWTVLMSVCTAVVVKKEKFVQKKSNEKRKTKRKKVEDKMLGWGDRDDSKLILAATVVLSNMFTTAEMREDLDLRDELEADVREECIKLGSVDLVKVCENHPHGVVLVRYRDRIDAQKCVQLMDRRWYGGRKIHAVEDDGSENHSLIPDQHDEEQRLEKFAAELEAW